MKISVPQTCAGLAVLLFMLTLLSCSFSDADGAGKEVLLATTTSVFDTGLIDAIEPLFHKQTGYRLKTIAVGSGRALAMGRAGDVDVLLVHARPAEEKFMKSGFGRRRVRIMHNYFVIVGPADDPARVMQAKSSSDALARISRSSADFFSRGDNSGTHQKEKAILSAAGIAGGWKGYTETGQGMAATLAIANERKGYTLSDIGTYLSQKRHLDLVILFDKDPSLLNVYSVIEVAGSSKRPVNADAARAFADFLASPKTKKFIGAFAADKFGRPLFIPD